MNEHIPALLRAEAALDELRDAMAQIRHAHPAYSPGTEPTAADNCSQILEVMDWHIRQIRVYLQGEK